MWVKNITRLIALGCLTGVLLVREEPSLVIEKPSSVNEKPSKVREGPASVNEEPSKLNGEPSKVNEEPSKVNGEPSKVNGEPSKVNEEPSKVNEERSSVNEEPSKVNEEPSAVREEPSKVNEEPSKVREEPSKVNEGPSKVSEVSSSVREEPSHVASVCDRRTLPSPARGWRRTEGVEILNFEFWILNEKRGGVEMLDLTAEAQWRGTTWTGANATCPEGGPPAGGIKGRKGTQSGILRGRLKIGAQFSVCASRLGINWRSPSRLAVKANHQSAR